MHPRDLLRLCGDLLGEALFPSRCAACDAPVGPRVLLCGACALSVLAPYPGDTLAPFAYGGAVAVAMKRFKYEGRSDLAVRLGRALGACVRGKLAVSAVEVVVAVPLHPRKRAERGFEQAELLAREVAAELGVPRAPGAISRVRHTSAQASLGREARLANVEGAFVAHPRHVRGRRVLLVDDVVTTGATVAAAARALGVAGARAVRVAACAVRLDEGP